jgi:hypothetical protein
MQWKSQRNILSFYDEAKRRFCSVCSTIWPFRNETSLRFYFCVTQNKIEERLLFVFPRTYACKYWLSNFYIRKLNRSISLTWVDKFSCWFQHSTMKGLLGIRWHSKKKVPHVKNFYDPKIHKHKSWQSFFVFHALRLYKFSQTELWRWKQRILGEISPGKNKQTNFYIKIYIKYQSITMNLHLKHSVSHFF